MSAEETVGRRVDENATAAGGDDDDGESVEKWIGVLAAVVLLTICVAANILLIVAVKRPSVPVPTSSSMYHHRRHRSSNCGNGGEGNAEKLACLIATIAVANGSGICIAQIVTFVTGNWSLSDVVCKVHGMASNLMTLLIIWFEALFAFERYLKFVKPLEYQTTFSRLNLHIILTGIVLIMISAVFGPIYGWGDYTYQTGAHLCQLRLDASNAVSYFVVTTVSYVVIPLAIMAYSCLALLLNVHCCGSRSSTTNHRWNNSLERRHVVLPLTTTFVVTILLQLPRYVMCVEDVLLRSGIDRKSVYAAAWLQTFAVNCCFACPMLLFHVCCHHHRDQECVPPACVRKTWAVVWECSSCWSMSASIPEHPETPIALRQFSVATATTST